MSNLKRDSGEDHPEAAAKHLDDSLALLDQRRYDNAAYLAGYVIECTMKTLILLEQGDLRVHDLEQLSRRA
ncbi:MAG: HEPN domain-containing protein [Planctomycetota bacterium]|nr:MAG: HEPN domain-containing protein [Planctomycetota bacterium]